MSTTTGTVALPGANRTGIPLPRGPVTYSGGDIIARLERAHARPSSSPFTRDTPAVKIDGRKRTDPERDRRIRELYIEDGQSIRQVAASVGMSPAGVRGAMERLAIEPRTQGRKTTATTHKEISA